MNPIEYYRKRFADYPDIVTLPEFRQMMEGIGDSTARKRIQENHVQHFVIQQI